MHEARLRRHSLPYVAPLEPHTGLKTSLQNRGQSAPDQIVDHKKDKKEFILIKVVKPFELDYKEF